MASSIQSADACYHLPLSPMFPTSTLSLLPQASAVISHPHDEVIQPCIDRNGCVLMLGSVVSPHAAVQLLEATAGVRVLTAAASTAMVASSQPKFQPCLTIACGPARCQPLDTSFHRAACALRCGADLADGAAWNVKLPAPHIDRPTPGWHQSPDISLYTP